MEHATPPHARSSLLRSGPLRLALIVGLTALAVLAPLASAVRTTDAQPIAAQMAPAPTPMPTPAPQEPVALPLPVSLTDDQPPAPIMVVGSDSSPALLTKPTDVPVEGTRDVDAPASCLLKEEVPASWFRDNFDSASADWRPLAGGWSVDGGSYLQTNPEGYDLITELLVPLPTSASISVDMKAQGDALGGGIMIGQPAPMVRNGATIIDFTDEGRFLRWGVYEPETGVYQYLGGVAMAADFDVAAQHNVSVELRPERTRVLLDGALIGAFDPVEPGQAGLVTSASAVAFDNLIVLDLDEDAVNGY